MWPYVSSRASVGGDTVLDAWQFVQTSQHHLESCSFANLPATEGKPDSSSETSSFLHQLVLLATIIMRRL